MRAGFVQTNPVFGAVEANIETAAGMISGMQADLIVLPELFSTGYQFTSKEEALELSEEVPSGPATRALAALSKERRIHIVAGLAERAGGKCYNSAVLTGPGGFIGVYRKTHLFSREKLWFDPGDTGFRVWKTPVGSIGIMVCFDWFFPESVRTLALQGAEIIAHPANLVLPFCPDAMVTRCIENRVYAITANRVGTEERGTEERLTFIGRSEVVSPKGQILVRASDDKEESAVVEIDPDLARDKGLNPLNDLFADRRPEMYR